MQKLLENIAQLLNVSVGTVTQQYPIFVQQYTDSAIWRVLGSVMVFFIVVIVLFILANTVHSLSALTECYREEEEEIKEKYIKLTRNMAIVLVVCVVLKSITQVLVVKTAPDLMFILKILQTIQ